MEVLTHKCPNCGGPLTFDPKDQKFHCDYCLSIFTEEEVSEYEKNKKKLELSAQLKNQILAMLVLSHLLQKNSCQKCLLKKKQLLKKQESCQKKPLQKRWICFSVQTAAPKSSPIKQQLRLIAITVIIQLCFLDV